MSAQPWGPQSWGSAPQNHPGVPTLLLTSPHLSLPQGHHQPLCARSCPAATSTLLNQNLPPCCPFVGPHWGVLLSLPAQMGSPVPPACPALSCKQSRSDPGGLAEAGAGCWLQQQLQLQGRRWAVTPSPRSALTTTLLTGASWCRRSWFGAPWPCCSADRAAECPPPSEHAAH